MVLRPDLPCLFFTCTPGARAQFSQWLTWESLTWEKPAIWMGW